MKPAVKMRAIDIRIGQARTYKAVVANLLEAAGLNYGALPKGLLKFHKYEDGARTPLEEHWWKVRSTLRELTGK